MNAIATQTHVADAGHTLSAHAGVDDVAATMCAAGDHADLTAVPELTDTVVAIPVATIVTAVTTGRAATELFGSFFLGDDEFALPASSIREVVNYPQKVTRMPLSPHFLEGVFTLRGAVIPVLNLARIFDPQAGAAEPTHKIAIVDHQDIQVGLVFHATGEILRVRPEQRSMFAHRDNASHNVVGGTIRLEDGARLLQILDPAALISIENVPQVLALKSAGRSAERSHFHLQAERRQCVAFKAGGTAFAFEMSAIREIIAVPELKSSVLNGKLCIGRINLRGSPVAVVDFARLLQVDNATPMQPNPADAANPANPAQPADAAAGAARRIVIARIGDASIGLLVDSVDNILSFFPGDVLPIPLLSTARTGMFGGCIHKEGVDPILFLNHEEIFSSSEIIDMTRGHAALYAQEGSPSGKDGQATAAVAGKGGDTQRTVYITFTVGNTYALEIRKIREIIDDCADLLTPPGMPDFIEGMLNLRRQMVTVLNLRALYGMPPLAETSPPKIIVIDHGEERYGLMVDAVENIVTVADSNRMAAPSLMRGSDPAGLRSQMQEVLELQPAQRGYQTVNVFEPDRLLERLAQEMHATGVVC
jgi:purine-binding chemotaxis protein CheW